MQDTLISRTGHTGEDGFEVWFDASLAVEVWNRLLHSPPPATPAPIGMAARDVLRLEAGMPLYGHEINDCTTPVEAGLMWCVRNSGGFVGAEAIQELAARGARRKLIGFVSDGRRVPRQGYPVMDGDEIVGEVRSGTQSPTLDCNIGTAYVSRAKGSPDANLQVDLRGDRTPIEIVELPFYRRVR